MIPLCSNPPFLAMSIFLLCLIVTIPLSIHALPAPRGFLLNCGASKETNVGTLKWITDDGFIAVGNKTTLDMPDLIPILATLRFFPDKWARKYCYTIPVIKGGKYMVRTTYYYGGFDGGKEPPVFDQIIEGTKWSIVNTTEDYSKGLSTYYDIVVAALGKTLSVCLAMNEHTVSAPFISGLELEYLEDSMYNSTDFKKYALSTVARNRFGHGTEMISDVVVTKESDFDGEYVNFETSFPDDQFNRYWQPFTDANPTVSSHTEVTSSDFWNFPPVQVFATAITTSRGKSLKVQWPTVPLPSSNYYIALYFQDNRTPSPYSWRVFNVSVNGKKFYTDLNVSATGVTVYATEWPLSGLTEITMTPEVGVPVGPIINAAEIFQIVPLDGRTLTRDGAFLHPPSLSLSLSLSITIIFLCITVLAMEDLARSLDNPPPDWSGDPCLPRQNSWTGVTCSQGKLVRILNLNLTGIGISGMLSSGVANLTALTNLWLGSNKLSGPIPDMSSMNALETLHLENNQFEGSIPPSLGQIANLREILLQNNNLRGRIPDILQKRDGINIQVSPGNHLSA
ncbi:hypothetical protein HHK36_009933 [Tetracentron sinense]|uniref:Malectin-like domain-containing protein n=1 Tax=Tetracentron sinense TaxID=13715 RepID=A0A834ZJW4_TETSI|nr:hypothetical protein HHK36_009933 [Tetracentron sinense]